MRLKKAQKEATIEWVAEGLDTGEINKRANEFKPPFMVSRTQVDYYRKSRNVQIQEIREQGEFEALNTGLARRSERVHKLKELAERLYDDLMGSQDLIWTEQVKGVGSGESAMIVDYLEFNTAEIAAYRGLLDDIAKELGDRALRQEIAGVKGSPLQIEYVNDWRQTLPGDHE